MIKLFSLKQQKKDGEATPKAGNQKKASAAQLRITKGMLKLLLRSFPLLYLDSLSQLRKLHCGHRLYGMRSDSPNLYVVTVKPNLCPIDLFSIIVDDFTCFVLISKLLIHCI